VIVKPLFGSMGFGMARVADPDVAARVFGALELERAVYYLQETVPHAVRDVRALVVGDRVVAAIARVGSGWRSNLARGARAEPVRLEGAREDSRCGALAAVGADYGGVDLLRGEDWARLRGGGQRDPRLAWGRAGDGVDVAGALVEAVERLVG
jgi:glutathione synthase/RimK-type ligase-like ATP-grasp enzyme